MKIKFGSTAVPGLRAGPAAVGKGTLCEARPLVKQAKMRDVSKPGKQKDWDRSPRRYHEVHTDTNRAPGPPDNPMDAIMRMLG
jgi:hypothetical protein